MSIGSLGMIGTLASTAQSQRAAEADKSPQSAAEQTRSADASERAELAAGIGQTAEDSEASDRDADGRRLWERPAPKRAERANESPQSSVPALAKDPTGMCGGELDLVG